MTADGLLAAGAAFAIATMVILILILVIAHRFREYEYGQEVTIHKSQVEGARRLRTLMNMQDEALWDGLRGKRVLTADNADGGGMIITTGGGRVTTATWVTKEWYHGNVRGGRIL